MIFRYTVKHEGDDHITHHYVEAYSEKIAREALAEHLDIPISKIGWNGKNVPFKVRKYIGDSNNKEYVLTISVDTKPSKNDETTGSALFDLKKSLAKGIQYKIDHLFADDESFLRNYSSKKDAYDIIRKEIIKSDLANEIIPGSNSVTYLERIDCYLANQSNELQKDFFNEKEKEKWNIKSST
jgi:hypothetical protein